MIYIFGLLLLQSQGLRMEKTYPENPVISPPFDSRKTFEQRLPTSLAYTQLPCEDELANLASEIHAALQFQRRGGKKLP